MTALAGASQEDPGSAFRPRVARSRPAPWNVAKTLIQAAAMWALFFAALPLAVLAAEEAAGLVRWRFDATRWVWPAAAVFVVAGTVGLSTGVLLAVRGDGTPLPFDTARRLVVAGPYRFVRNPMAMASFAQGAAVGVALGSPAVLGYVAAGMLVWNFVARPWEERDLLRRFGDAYSLYRRRVRCWRIRVRPYDPAREDREPPVSAERTTPPGRFVVLYDGRCRLCQVASERLVRLGRPGAIERLSFRATGVLGAFPGVTPEACENAMHVVLPDGRVHSGAEAAARSLATRPALGFVAALYFVPGVRLAVDVVYAWIARNRLRWFGTAEPCADGTCRIH